MFPIELLQKLTQHIDALTNYIDAIPDEQAAAFPAMPGMDRDDLMADLEDAKKLVKSFNVPPLYFGEQKMGYFIEQNVSGIKNLDDFSDWVAGQKESAVNTGFVTATYIDGTCRAYYQNPTPPQDLQPSLIKGQRLVWMPLP